MSAVSKPGSSPIAVIREALENSGDWEMYHSGSVTQTIAAQEALQLLEEQITQLHLALRQAEKAFQRLAEGAFSNPPRDLSDFAREAQENAHATLTSIDRAAEVLT